MFNNVRRCLITLVRNRGKLSVRSTHEDVLFMFRSRANAECSNYAACKRFCSHSTTKTQNPSEILRNQQRKLDKQKLDEFLSVPENKKRFEILELEVDVFRHNAEKIPTNIEEKDWLVLLNTRATLRRKKYLEFLWCNEKTSENRKAKKEAKKAEFLAFKQKSEQIKDTNEIIYSLQKNSLFIRIYEQTINHAYNGKLIMNMMFESKIVFDCSYENNMTTREIHNCAKQLSLAFASNRTHIKPMDLYFCNFNRDGLLKQHLHQSIPTLLNDDFPVTVTSQSYLDIFPKDQLVYLTPDSKINLNEYDPNMVYIIGALVDKGKSLPLSVAKAKKEGIRMAKFPIDQYLNWGFSSSKNLTLDQMIKVMLDLRHTKDWKEALKNVPTRKLKPARDSMLQYKLQKSHNKLQFLEHKKTQKFISSDKLEIQKSDVQKSTFFDKSMASKIPLNFTFQNRKMN